MGRITTNREILGGKPVIKGTRISVEFVLELSLPALLRTKYFRIIRI